MENKLNHPPAYPQWTDAEWNELLTTCRLLGITMPEEEVREAAYGYMQEGAAFMDWNRWGLVGTIIALNVDRISTGT